MTTEPPVVTDRGVRGRMKNERRREKADRKKEQRKREAGARVQLPCCKRVYAVGRDGAFLRIDGKRGQKNRQKGLIE